MTDWKNLKDAHGKCGHYPKIFPKFLSQSHEKIDQAYWSLDNHAILQSDIYEVTPHVITELLFLLDVKLVPHARIRIYGFLIEAGFGHSPEEDIMRAVRQALQDGIPAYIKDLKSQNEYLRHQVYNLLLSLVKEMQGYEGVICEITQAETATKNLPVSRELVSMLAANKLPS